MNFRHFKSELNQFLHLDTETILSAPLYILLDIDSRSCFVNFLILKAD